jgi:hypothetical protein
MTLRHLNAVLAILHDVASVRVKDVLVTAAQLTGCGARLTARAPAFSAARRPQPVRAAPRRTRCRARRRRLPSKVRLAGPSSHVALTSPQTRCRRSGPSACRTCSQ